VDNVDAGVQVPRDELLLEENIEVVEVAMDDGNVERVVMNGDEQVSDDDNFVGVFDLSLLYDIEGVSKYFL